jgi:hypothetical protein
MIEIQEQSLKNKDALIQKAEMMGAFIKKRRRRIYLYVPILIFIAKILR